MNTNMPPLAGDNVPDYGKEEGDRLRRDYAALENTVAEIETESTNFPLVISDEDTLGKATVLMKRIRDLSGQADAYHTAEKEPHRRRGEANDSFFFGLIDRLKRRDKRNKPGAYELLGARVEDYQQRKLAEEETRRRREAEEALRKEQEAAALKAKLEREAEEARLAAERARNPEKKAEKEEAAAVAEQRADEAHVEAQVATVKADDAVAETRATPADIVRTRVQGGPLATMRQEPYADVIDVMKLDKEKLWSFIKRDEIEKGLRAWAKVTGHKEQMEGAAIGFRNKSVVR